MLSLLGIKNLGRNPDLLMESVQPVLDAQGWYLRSSAVAYRQDFVTAAVSENFSPAFLTAGENEWLYVHYAFGSIFTPGGSVTADGNWLVYKSVPGSSLLIYKTPPQPSILSGGAGFCTSTILDIWIPPGFSLLLEGADMVIASSVPTIGALVSRIQV